MSSKKKDKNEWVECETCNGHFLRSFISKHQKSCFDEEHLSAEDSLNDPVVEDNIGYIKNSVFYGLLKKSDQINASVPRNRYDLIQINPKTIKLCNFQVASSVTLQFKNIKTYCTIWPNSSVPLDSLHISKNKMKFLNVKETDNIAVMKESMISLPASSIAIQSTEKNGNVVFENLKDSLLLTIDNCTVQVGEFISCMHYNQKYCYKIKFIDSKTSTIDEITESTSALSLDSSKVSSEMQVVYTAVFSQTILTLDIAKDEKHNTENTHADPDRTIIYSQIGGLELQKELLNDLVLQPFRYPQIYDACCVTIPKGIIIHGQSGTGKTMLAKGIIELVPNVYHYFINGPELTSKYMGETEEKLRYAFEETVSKSPSILVIDELDSICPSRAVTTNDSERRVVATLIKLMDNVPANKLFVVLGLTNNLSAIDISLRRPGRFEKEIETSVPNVKERLDIFTRLLKTKKHSLDVDQFNEISEITHGYVGADIDALCKESGMIAVKKLFNEKNYSSGNSIESCNFQLTINDMKIALLKVRPSALKAVTLDIPKVHWCDIGGQKSVIQKLKEAIEWPLKFPEVFDRMGISPPRGLLMYGPPGCSKTLMAKALATESSLNFISIKGPELFNKYLGESEKAIRDIFSKAREAAPSIIFFDEIDAIGVKRSANDSGNSVADRVLAQMLTELDGVESLDNVIIVAATNRPDIIDSALLRPGRIDRLIYVPLPDEVTRKEIFEIQFRTIPISKNVNLDSLIQLSAGFSGAEICSVCRESAMLALREDFECIEVNHEHFETILKQIKPAATKDLVDFYENFVEKTTGTF